MFIQIEETPNPNTVKFLLGFHILSPGKTIDTSEIDDVGLMPSLASDLLAIDGVQNLFFSQDFISLTKTDAFSWDIIKPDILTCIMEFFEKHETLEDGILSDNEEEFFSPNDTETVEKIKQLMDNYIRPAVMQDGGDIKFRGFENGTVFVKLKGACSGCPSAGVTLKNGVENMLRYHLPEIISVESI